MQNRKQEDDSDRNTFTCSHETNFIHIPNNKLSKNSTIKSELRLIRRGRPLRCGGDVGGGGLADVVWEKTMAIMTGD